MPRAGLSAESVTALALAVVDGGGPAGFEQLSLAAVATRAGVAVPSLYKHVGSLDELRRRVAVATVRELGSVLAAATVGLAGADALRALADALRAWALANPGRYAATQRAPSQQDAADAELRAAAAAVVATITTALRGFALPEDAAVDAVRLVRSAVHGFVSLELGGGFGLPDDLDRSFARMVAVLAAGLADGPTR